MGESCRVEPADHPRSQWGPPGLVEGGVEDRDHVGGRARSGVARDQEGFQRRTGGVQTGLLELVSLAPAEVPANAPPGGSSYSASCPMGRECPLGFRPEGISPGERLARRTWWQNR